MSSELCNDEICEVKTNNPAILDITFKTTNEESKLAADAEALVAGSWLKWPLGDATDVCKNLIQGSCPVPANTEATYRVSVTIPSSAPIGFQTTVQIGIAGQNNVVACTRFPVKVVA